MVHNLRGRHRLAQHLRHVARQYGIALGLTWRQFSVMPEITLRERPAMVRTVVSERGGATGFDPREEVVPGVVLTLPLGHEWSKVTEPNAQGAERSRFEANYPDPGVVSLVGWRSPGRCAQLQGIPA